MGAALLGENIITEAQNVLLKGIHELEGYLHLHPVDGGLYNRSDREPEPFRSSVPLRKR